MGIARCRAKIDVENVPHGECDGCGHMETAVVLQVAEDPCMSRWSSAMEGLPHMVAVSYVFRGLREVRDLGPGVVLCATCEVMAKGAAARAINERREARS